MPKKKREKESIKDLKFLNILGLFFAGVINGFGVTMFLVPSGLYDSGISGLSMFLERITPAFLILPIFLIVLNVPIFIFGYKQHGLLFTFYSIFSVLIYALSAFLFVRFLPSPFADLDLILCAIFGGALSGIGSGLTIRFGGALDGMDVLSVTFAKKLNISVGSFTMIFNVIIYTVSGIVFTSWALPLYSVIAFFVGGRVIDFMVDGIDKSKCAMIITTKVKEVNQIIKENFESSGTFIDAVGAYKNEEKNIIYFVINRFQVSKLKRLVRECDENAFISLLEVSDLSKGNVETKS